MSEKYQVNVSRTRRYKVSAVPYLQGLLNRDNLEKKQGLKKLMTNLESSQSLRKGKDPKYLVLVK